MIFERTSLQNYGEYGGTNRFCFIEHQMTQKITELIKTIDLAQGLTTVPSDDLSQHEEATLLRNPSITFQQILGMKVPVGVFNVSVSDLADALIYKQTIHSNYMTGFLNQGNNMLQNFRFFRMTFKFTVEVVSVFQQVGAATILFVPFTSNMYKLNNRIGWSVDPVLPYTKILQLPHQIITYGKCDTYEVDTEWTVVKEFIVGDEISSVSEMGWVQLTVLSPLKIAPSVDPQVTFRIWVTPIVERVDGFRPLGGLLP